MAIKIIEGPRFCAPINASPGLYIEALSEEGRATRAELLAAVRKQVSAAGYNPDGRGMVGPPCGYGIVSYSYAMWFYDRAKG
jgi:hypothetical protein